MLPGTDNAKAFIAPLANHAGFLHPNILDSLKENGFPGESFNMLVPVFYVADKTQQKYLYFDSSCKQVLGYDVEFMAKAGPNFYMSLLHENDYKVYQEKIFPENMIFLKKENEKTYSDFLFSCNYRIKKNDGKYVNMLQRIMYFLLTGEDARLIEVGLITDITNYKADTRIIHIIEKAGRDPNAPSGIHLFKSVYFPDKAEGILSRREMEILKDISEGLSSKEIASKLFISINTINNHRKNMLQKTHTNNFAELLNYALNNSLL
jgi:DNA-binding CsgD family transcriptional regulator